MPGDQCDGNAIQPQDSPFAFHAVFRCAFGGHHPAVQNARLLAQGKKHVVQRHGEHLPAQRQFGRKSAFRLRCNGQRIFRQPLCRQPQVCPGPSAAVGAHHFSGHQQTARRAGADDGILARRLGRLIAQQAGKIPAEFGVIAAQRSGMRPIKEHAAPAPPSTAAKRI